MGARYLPWESSIQGRIQLELFANKKSLTLCKDEFAQSLRKAAEDDGVSVKYMEDATTPTGTCAVVITDSNRSLVANVSAANNFNVAHLKKPEIDATVQRAKFFYVEGYFLTHNIESALYLANHAHDTGKTFMMNISAPFLAQFFKDQMSQCTPYWDVIFGTFDEGITLKR